MNRTKIEWVKSPDGSQGFTFNPITGCLNCTPDGMCKGGNFPCYAYRLAHGRLKNVYLANHNMLPFESIEDEDGSDHWQFHDPFYPRFWEDRLQQMVSRNDYLDGDLPRPTKPKGFFVCDMSDLFGIGVPEEWTIIVLDTIAWNKYYDRFYLLTKQPQNLAKFSPFLDNCYVGVTATDRKMWFDAVWELQDVKASMKYISFEPLLSWEHGAASSIHSQLMADWFKRSGINWVIIGAQTKPTVYPKIEWVKEIVEAADTAGIPVFLKDNLKPLFSSLTALDLPRFNFWEEFRVNVEDESKNIIKLRQELPR